MKIISPPELSDQNNTRAIFIDTNVFIAAIGDRDFLVFLDGLHRTGHTLFTIPQVVYEFTRGSDSIATYNRRLRFIQALVDSVYPIDRHTDVAPEFTVLMQKHRPNGQYTDFLLCTCLYRLSDSFLLTSDHSAMPMEFFDRELIVTTDNGKSILNIGLYKINQTRLDRALSKLASSDS